jgi:hypothetical protein
MPSIILGEVVDGVLVRWNLGFEGLDRKTGDRGL